MTATSETLLIGAFSFSSLHLFHFQSNFFVVVDNEHPPIQFLVEQWNLCISDAISFPQSHNGTVAWNRYERDSYFSGLCSIQHSFNVTVDAEIQTITMSALLVLVLSIITCACCMTKGGSLFTNL